MAEKFKFGGIVNAINRIVESLGNLSISISGDQKDYVTRAFCSTNQSINNSTFTKVALNTKTFDQNNLFDNITNYRWTCPIAGFYQINAAVLYNAPAATGQYQVKVYKNGAEILYSNFDLTVAISAYPNPKIADTIYLEKGDYLELYTFHNAGTAKTLLGGQQFNYLSIAKINTYIAPTPTETNCKFKVTQNIAQSFNSGAYTKMNFDAKVFDPSGTFDLTNDYYVAPESGYYLLSAGVFFTTATALLLGFSTDGVFTVTNETSILATNEQCLTLTALVYVNKGDKIGVCARQTIGSAQNTTSAQPRFNFFSGHKISN